jgi:hypothetical protein
MPQLKWNEADFLDCFGVAPIVGDDRVSHSYEARRSGLRLRVTVRQYESVLNITLSREGTESELLSLAAYVRGEARYVNDIRGTYLEITNCFVAPGRFWYMEAGNVFDRQRFPVGVTVEIGVNPDIRVVVVPYRSRT